MNGTLVDSNLLCLLAVGRVDRAAISDHPRLKAFDGSDYDAVGQVIDRLGDPVLCAPVLAETSNLVAYRQTAARRERYRRSLGALIELFLEVGEPARGAVGDRAYARLGLNDAVLLLLAARRGLSLLSDDLDLCVEAGRRGFRTVNYNYVRDGAVRIEQL